MEDATLEMCLVGDIAGAFFVPCYQRGYRWGKQEVESLLNDIYDNGENCYCIQPIVVRKCSKGFELIDGQQRLTTLYLIYKYMINCHFLKEVPFTLLYETRKESEDFLLSIGDIDTTRKDENIDFYYISLAYEVIQNWFGKHKDKCVMEDFNKYLKEYVKAIWYEVGEGEDAASLFRRLNIGKIPLTNAELVKAVFMRRMEEENKVATSIRTIEIALEWNEMEEELQEPSFWFFLTGEERENCTTHFDLLLELMADNPKNKYGGAFDTFFYFNKILSNKKSADECYECWRSIRQVYFTLKGWYEDNNLYHNIGYLIACGAENLKSIYTHYKGKTRDKFNKYLRDKMRESIKLPENKDYQDLSYEEDYKLLYNILLLFNVVSVRELANKTVRFSFSEYKRNKWSLEHITAQNSKPLRKLTEWRVFLLYHKPYIKEYNTKDIGKSDNEKEKLLLDIDNALIKDKDFTYEEFQELQKRILHFLEDDSIGINRIHSLSNLALLSTSNNSVLSNSVFAVKREKIIELDKNGEFIPYCTKMVFLKYYSPSSSSQLSFWSPEDRECYIDAMNDVLKEYLQGWIKE